MRSLFNLPLSLLTHILRRHTCSMVSHLQVFCAIFKLLHLHCVGRPEPQDGTDLREPGPSASGLPRMEEQERCSSTILQNGVSNSEKNPWISRRTRHLILNSMYSLSYMLIGTFAIHNICKEYTLIMDKETPGRILIVNIHWPYFRKSYDDYFSFNPIMGNKAVSFRHGILENRSLTFSLRLHLLFWTIIHFKSVKLNY